MFIAMFVALTILVAAILIARCYYLGKIEKLNLAHEDKINLDFRRGFDAGWVAGLEQGKRDRTYITFEKIPTT